MTEGDVSEKETERKRATGNNGVPTPVSPGRPKGIPNKSTTLAREAIARFVDGNSDRLQTWLDDIAATNPKDAFNCFMNVIEYHIPKLARTEVTAKDGEELFTPYAERTEAERLEIAKKVAFLLQGGIKNEGLPPDHRPADRDTGEK